MTTLQEIKEGILHSVSIRCATDKELLSMIDTTKYTDFYRLMAICEFHDRARVLYKKEK